MRGISGCEAVATCTLAKVAVRCRSRHARYPDSSPVALAGLSTVFSSCRCALWLATRTPICAALEKSDPSGPRGQCPKLGTRRRWTALLWSKVEAEREGLVEVREFARKPVH